MSDVLPFIGRTQSRQQMLNSIARYVAAHEQQQRAPAVRWLALNETPDNFSQRLAPLVFSGRLLLAVVPAGTPVIDGARVVELTEKAFEALHPSRKSRYVVLRGGRGGTKSWAVARSLVLAALTQPLRILCLREIQRSLKDSSLRLLADTISALGLDRYFTVMANSITSTVGASFLFEGCYANVARIKSLEGIDIAWIEQAEQVSEESWSVLLPTVRKPGSRILISYNPDLRDDPTHVRFTLNAPPGTIEAELSYLDNPWASPEMLAEAEYLKRVDLDAFNHVWMGTTREASDAQVLRGKYEVADFEVSRDWAGPFMGADWGFSVDPTTLVRSFIDEAANTLYVTDEAYQVECPLDRLPLLFGTVPGSRDSVIYADNARPEVINHMQSRGYGNIRACAKWDGSVQDGILALRSFAKIIINPRCEHVAQEAKLYSYRTDRTTGEVLPDLKPGNDHTIDALRYSLQERIRRPAGAGLLQWYSEQLSKQQQPAPAETPPTRRDPLWKSAAKLGGTVSSI